MVIVVNLNDPVEGKENHRIAIWDEHKGGRVCCRNYRYSPGQKDWCMGWTTQKRNYFTFKSVPNYVFRINLRGDPHVFVYAELLFRSSYCVSRQFFFLNYQKDTLE